MHLPQSCVVKHLPRGAIANKPTLMNTQLAPWEPVISKGNSFQVVLNSKYKQLLKQGGSYGRLCMDNTLSCIQPYGCIRQNCCER